MCLREASQWSKKILAQGYDRDGFESQFHQFLVAEHEQVITISLSFICKIDIPVFTSQFVVNITGLRLAVYKQCLTYN